MRHLRGLYFGFLMVFWTPAREAWAQGRAIARGFLEADSDLTTHYDYPLITQYDRGRAVGRWLRRRV